MIDRFECPNPESYFDVLYVMDVYKTSQKHLVFTESKNTRCLSDVFCTLWMSKRHLIIPHRYQNFTYRRSVKTTNRVNKKLMISFHYLDQ